MGHKVTSKIQQPKRRDPYDYKGYYPTHFLLVDNGLPETKKGIKKKQLGPRVREIKKTPQLLIA